MNAPDDFDWLDELPFFLELQTLTAADEFDSSKFGDCSFNSDQQQLSPSNGSSAAEIDKKSTSNKDLFSVSYENAATLILSNENIYVNNESFVSLDPLQSECVNGIEEMEEELSEMVYPKNADVQPVPPLPDPRGEGVITELDVVDEIIRNTAIELDQWESDTTRSEISSDGTSGTDLSSKEKEEETDDPDWRPVTANSPGRKCAKRAKPYCRGGSLEEKKLRKKEQNKNAATRYRQKKKAEIHEILREEEKLKEKRAKLQETAADIEHEIKCVKAFMRDFFKAKGMIVG